MPAEAVLSRRPSDAVCRFAATGSARREVSIAHALRDAELVARRLSGSRRARHVVILSCVPRHRISVGPYAVARYEPCRPRGVPTHRRVTDVAAYPLCLAERDRERLLQGVRPVFSTRAELVRLVGERPESAAADASRSAALADRERSPTGKTTWVDVHGQVSVGGERAGRCLRLAEIRRAVASTSWVHLCDVPAPACTGRRRMIAQPAGEDLSAGR